MTTDGITQIFAVNVVAPYVLTALITRPGRMIYLSSDMHQGGDPSLDDPQWEARPWNSSQAYSDTKLHDHTLSMFVARHWPDVLVNAVDPGWVPTRMGGPNAPDDLREGATTQAWLAASDDSAANVSGRFFHHQAQHRLKRAASSLESHQGLVEYLKRLTGSAFHPSTHTLSRLVEASSIGRSMDGPQVVGSETED